MKLFVVSRHDSRNEKKHPQKHKTAKSKPTSTKLKQKQPSKGVRRKRCSENTQQVYRRKPMPKCNFKKVAKHFLHKK